MDLLHERYGVGYFLWADDEAIIDRRFIYDFCDLMGREKKEYEFSVAGRVNLVDEPLLTRLRDAGCTMVGYGIESGSQKILDAMKKGVTVEQARNAVRLTQRIFGDADCSFMIGYPGETDETIRETEEFCRDLGLAPEVIFFATAYPGTPLYEYAKDQGLITDEVAYISTLWEQGEKIAINFTGWPDEVLLQKRQALIESLNAWNRTRHSLDERI
jgi:anaerobic magnesium-protoporphyrin IX monomethyl ester cyclase